MSIMADNPLRLPPYRITGNTTAVPGGMGVTGEVEPYSWTGRPVGLQEDRVRTPVLWTLGSLAGMAGVAEGDYAATSPSAVAVAPSNFRHPLSVPKAVIYFFNPILHDAARDVESQLSAAGVLAAKIPHGITEGSTTTVPLSLLTAATGYELLNDEAPFDPMSPLPIEWTIPTGEPSSWVGGQVLGISIFQLDSGFDVYSIADPGYPGVTFTFPDIIARARSDYLQWQPRYDRVKLLVMAYTPPGEPVTETEFNRNVFVSVLAGLPGVELIDLGTVDAPTRTAQMKAIASQAMLDFFGLS